MADFFAPPAPAGKRPPGLHSETELYLAVDRLGAYLFRAIQHIPKGMKAIVGEALIYEATEMAELVRRANIARGAEKLPFLDEVLARLEKLQYMLRNANAAELLAHKTYAASIEITTSIGRQTSGLKNKFNAPAPSPAT